MIQQTILKPVIDLDRWLRLHYFLDRKTSDCHSKHCDAELSYWQNYNNAYCWNHIVDICRNKGHFNLASEIMDNHL